MVNNKSSWLEKFKRECGIRRGVILHGNVNDLVCTTENGVELDALSEVLQKELFAKGYRHVITWNKITGLSGMETQDWQKLQAQTVAETFSSNTDNEYEMGDLNEGITATSQKASITPISAMDFFSVAAAHMRACKPEKIAFIIDWSQYLFGNVNSLSEEERGILLMMGMASRNAHVSLSRSEVTESQSLMIFLCQGISVLPPALYLNNPLFSEIAIPLPDRLEREKIVKMLGNILYVQPELMPNSRALADFIDSIDGLTIRDIYNMARLSRQFTDHVLNSESLVTLYRYGERESPWENLSHNKLMETKAILSQRVKGQSQAIEKVNRVLIRAYTGLSGLQHSQKQCTPKGVLFFVGPTGVGKTELAKSLAQFLFGDESACIRFDMSEFNHEHADQRLVGAPPGYVGFEEGGQLTNAIKEKPFSLLLFDEIEKAHPRILDKFLQILEDGRLTDGKGDTVSFSETLIVFTSNIGAAEVSPDSSEETIRNDFIKIVREHFITQLNRPELLSRIGESNIIPFNFVSNNDFLIEIARAKLQPLRNRLSEKWNILDLKFENEFEALECIINKVDKSSGGRGVLNALTECFFDPLAVFLFDSVCTPENANGKTIQVIKAKSCCFFDFELVD